MNPDNGSLEEKSKVVSNLIEDFGKTADKFAAKNIEAMSENELEEFMLNLGDYLEKSNNNLSVALDDRYIAREEVKAIKKMMKKEKK